MYISLKIYIPAVWIGEGVKVYVIRVLDLREREHVHCLDSAWRGHKGGVTSSRCYANPLVNRHEVRLVNPRKTKVPSIRPDVHNGKRRRPGENRSSERALAVHAAAHLSDIDDGKMAGFYITANGL